MHYQRAIRFGLLVITVFSLTNCTSTPTQYYHVSFDAKGGTPVPDEQLVEANHCATLPTPPTKQMAEFNWWQKTGTNTSYNFSTPVTSDLKLEANYTNYYRVDFVTFGGTIIPSEEVRENGSVNEPPPPEKSGAEFEGWYWSNPLVGGLMPFYFDTPIQHDTVLYAKFKNEYIVTFETFGGTKIDPVTVVSGQTVTQPPSPSKGIADFTGWCTDKSCTATYDFATPVYSSMTLYAKWEENWLVTLYAPGATPATQTKKVRDGQYVTDAIAPVMDNYVFKGWHYTQIFPEGEEPINLATTPIKKNLLLFASWDRDIPKKTVTFKYNDGVTPDLIKQVPLGDYVTQPADPHSADTYFDGWYQGETLFDFFEPITDNLTLVAHYQDQDHRVVCESSSTLQFIAPTYSDNRFTVQITLANDVDPNFYYVPSALTYYDVTTSNGHMYTNYSLDTSSSPYTLTIDLTEQTAAIHVKANKAICKYMSFTGASDEDNWVSFNPDELRHGGGKLQYNKTLSETGWSEWTGGHSTDPGCLHIANGETVYVRGENDLLGGNKNSFGFRMNGKIKADGDITSLRNFSKEKTSYDGLFSGAKELITPPQLPLTKVEKENYICLFFDCSSLEEAPVLPATSVGEGGYSEMFCGCSALKQMPSLPATNLAEQSYRSMFSGCHSLNKVVPLWAENIPTDAYESMFNNCTSLVQAPKIMAKQLGTRACESMFNNCSALRMVDDLVLTNLAEWSCAFMFSNCAALLKAPRLPSTNSQLANACYEKIFSGCHSLRDIEVGFDEFGFTHDSDMRYLYTTNWIEDVKAVGVFRWKGSEEYTNFSDSTIHHGWVIMQA